MQQHPVPPAQAGTPAPTAETPTPTTAAEVVRRQLVEHGRHAANVTAVNLTRLTAEITLTRLDLHHIVEVRTEIENLLDAVKVLDETVEEAQRKLAAADGRCPACGHRGTDADPLVETTTQHLVHRSHTTSPASGFYGTAVAR
jgi:hypothetical protein